MATAYVTIGTVAPVGVFSANVKSETVTTSGVAASGGIIAEFGQAAQVFCATHVYAKSGAGATVPSGTAGNGVYVPANTPTFIFMTQGQTISIIDAV